MLIFCVGIAWSPELSSWRRRTVSSQENINELLPEHRHHSYNHDKRWCDVVCTRRLVPGPVFRAATSHSDMAMLRWKATREIAIGTWFRALPGRSNQLNPSRGAMSWLWFPGMTHLARDRGRKNRRTSCALLSLDAMGTDPCAALMEPVVDSACIVIARAVRQGRPCPTGPSSMEWPHSQNPIVNETIGFQ